MNNLLLTRSNYYLPAYIILPTVRNGAFVEPRTLRYEVVVDYCVRKINTGYLGCLLIAIYNGDWEL